MQLDAVEYDIKNFVADMESKENIKLLLFVFMGHGSENDWLVFKKLKRSSEVQSI